MGPSQSTLQVSEEGFQLLIDTILPTTGSSSSSAPPPSSFVGTTTSTNTYSNSNPKNYIHNEISNYRIQNGLYPGSGRMNRTYRIAQYKHNTNQQQSQQQQSLVNNNNKNENDDSNHHHMIRNPYPYQQQQLSQSTAVLKAGWILWKPVPPVPPPSSSSSTGINNNNNNNKDQNHYYYYYDEMERTTLQEYLKELQRIKDLCYYKQLSHTAPYMQWYVGNEVRAYPKTIMQYYHKTPVPINTNPSNSATTTTTTTATTTTTIAVNVPSAPLPPPPPVGTPNITYVKSMYLIRQHTYTTLADRLMNRPWLQNSEKMWITYQILVALQQLHEVNIVHGFLTTENIGLTSAGYVILLDIGTYKNYKVPALLPDNDPSEYLYYFNSQNNHHHHQHHPLQHGTNYQQQQHQTMGGAAEITSSTSTTTSVGNSDNTQNYNNTTMMNQDTSTMDTTTTTTSTNNVNNHNQNNISATGGVGLTTPVSTSKTNSSSEKRCYLAPERFYTPSCGPIRNSGSSSTTKNKQTTIPIPPTTTTTTQNQMLTPAMDIFSLGCVLTELFLNGERCFDLGELMEYRRRYYDSIRNHHNHHHHGTDHNTTTNDNNSTSVNEPSSHHHHSDENMVPITLQQKLNKIESSTIRAACKHMLSIDPQQRLNAKQYYDRLLYSNQFATSFSYLTNLIECVTIPKQQQQQSQKDINTTSATTGLTPISSTTILTPDGLEDSSNHSNNSHSHSSCSDGPNLNQDDITNMFEKDMEWVNRDVTSVCPDARIAVAAYVYEKVLWICLGKRDPDGNEYFQKALGCHIVEDCSSTTKTAITQIKDDKLHINNTKNNVGGVESVTSNVNMDEKETNEINNDHKEEKKVEDLFSQVEALLKDLDMLEKNVEDTSSPVNIGNDNVNIPTKKLSETTERSSLCQSSILIYLQLITSSIRYVHRPSTKIIALQLLDRVSKFCDGTMHDEARLERIIPITVSLLQDQDAMVRGTAVQVLTNTLSLIQSFPPSDARIFPEYIFKRVGHMLSDPSLVVRIAFIRCIPVLAETAHRFLDITHAVRLYEAVGNMNHGVNGTSTLRGQNDTTGPGSNKELFGADIVKLLDTESRSPSKNNMGDDIDSGKVESASAVGNTLLITSSYSTELAALHEIISRWVVQLTIDQSEHSSLQKRAMLNDLSRLCAFFGLDGVMSFILPQILAFLNERKDWELRASLFEHLPSVCHIIGRAATEEFVLPCVEIGLVDSEECVICFALSCLSRMLEMGLLSRTVILGIDSTSSTDGPGGKLHTRTFLERYGVLLLHPAQDVRQHAINTFVTLSKVVGIPDRNVYIIPQLKTFFRFQPQAHHLISSDAFEQCLHNAWSRRKYNKLLKSLMPKAKRIQSIPGAWTSIGVMVRDDQDAFAVETVKRDKVVVQEEKEVDEKQLDPQMEHFQDYLKMLVKQMAQSPSQEAVDNLSNGIEGNVKLAQSIMFPRQNGKFQKSTLPDWYSTLRDKVEANESDVSEESTIKSISTLGRVYGLSIIGPAEGMNENIVGAADDLGNPGDNEEVALQTTDARKIEASFRGEWGSEAMLDPDVVDTCLLLTKLKAVDVPPLPPKLGELGMVPLKRVAPMIKDAAGAPVESKVRIKGLVATSLSNSAHTAPVVRLAMSKDQYFFVSGSHDGTCRVWEISQLEDSSGILESSTIYSEHSSVYPTKIIDVAMLEGTHSVASGASDGSIHVWRVDMVQTKNSTNQVDQRLRRDRARVVGCSSVRKVDPSEGGIMAVSHFSSAASSVVTYATQKGVIHSWDLRCAREPFKLLHSPDLGYLSSMALGNDRNWMVTGTSKGFLTLWDIRFQQPLQLWQHSRKKSIARLATSSVLPPQKWNLSNAAVDEPRPYMFVAAGNNECSMFDAISGINSECFRTVVGNNRNINDGRAEEPPHLVPIPLLTQTRSSNIVKARHQQFPTPHVPPASTINCMVGSIGANSSSYLVTGGSDCAIRFWDFWNPAQCFVVAGRRSPSTQSRSSFERIDFDKKRRLMMCREMGGTTMGGSSNTYDPIKLLPHKSLQGMKKEEHHHSDSVQDIKIIDNNTIISCSRDSTVKVWK